MIADYGVVQSGQYEGQKYTVCGPYEFFWPRWRRVLVEDESGIEIRDIRVEHLPEVEW
jgi:hypothetical protein